MASEPTYRIINLKELSPEERRKVENKRENLYAQVKALKPKHKHDSGNTQKRYYSSVRQACKFFADNFNTQKFKNITAKQFRAAAAYWKENNSLTHYEQIYLLCGVTVSLQAIPTVCPKMMSYF